MILKITVFISKNACTKNAACRQCYKGNKESYMYMNIAFKVVKVTIYMEMILENIALNEELTCYILVRDSLRNKWGCKSSMFFTQNIHLVAASHSLPPITEER